MMTNEAQLHAPRRTVWSRGWGLTVGGGAMLLTLASCTDDGGRRSGPLGLGQDGAGGECVTPWGDPCEVPECDDPCGYNDPDTLHEQACVITGAPAQCQDVRGVQVSFQQGAGTTVPAPGGFFKPKDKMLEKWVTARWQETADFVIPALVKNQLTKGGVKVWNYPDGNGWIRADFHAGIMALPAGDKPATLLKAMADDVLTATGDGELGGWVGWPSSTNRKVGDRVDLDIWGPDNGPIGYWKMDTDRFCVITLENATVGAHPVNGIRCWGYVPMAINPNWTKIAKNKAKWGCAGPTYMFYTIGLDSPSVAGGGGVGSGLQAGTWNALIRDLLRENDRNGGVSGRYYQQITVAQPNALKPKSGVKVTGAGDRDSHYVGLPSDGYKGGEICVDPAPTGAADCLPEEYTCANGECLPAEQRCDGISQCVDRDDEDACDEPEVDGCPANQFACGDGQCIPEDWHCDGQYEDCSDGQDEASCDAADTGCKGDEFSCGNGSCIPGAWKCDAIEDCDDASDETMCMGGGDDPDAPDGGTTCAASEFACDDGQCIAASWQCDEISDCGGGEDEANCGGGDAPDEPEPPTCDGYGCSDGVCISATWECDGIVDCSDSGDEASCAPAPDGGTDDDDGGCGPDEFSCGDGQCIAASWECDVYVDCSGGQDEANC